MKKIVLTSILMAIIFINPLNAQVKKAITKPKAPLAAVKEPVFNKIDFFNQTPDNAIQLLSDELGKLKIVLQDLEDEPLYDYDATGKRLNTIVATTRKLVFDKEITVNLTSDKADQLTNITFESRSGNAKHFKAIKKMLGFSTWPIVSKSLSDTIFRSGNKIAYSSTIADYDEDGELSHYALITSMAQAEPYVYVPKENKPFDAQQLNVNLNGDDVGYALVELMKGMGETLLNKEFNLPIVSNNELQSYTCNYNFSHSITISINTTVSRKLKGIDIGCKDPITASKIKKSLGILQWTKTGGDEESKAAYYTHNNISCYLYNGGKFILFEVKPLETDWPSRLENTRMPDFDGLASLYQSGTEQETGRLITERYLNGIKYDNTAKKWVSDPQRKCNFYYKTPKANMTNCQFNYNVTVDNNWTIYLYSIDTEYLQKILAEYQKSKHKNNYVYILRMDNQEVELPNKFNEILFMDRAARSQQIAQYQQQQAELARQKEQQRLDAIERDRQRAAQSAETLNKLGDFIKNYGKKQ
jgi:hypothetical protein